MRRPEILKQLKRFLISRKKNLKVVRMWAASVPLGNIATRYLSRVLGVRSGNTCNLEAHSEKNLKQNSSSEEKVGKKRKVI